MENQKLISDIHFPDSIYEIYIPGASTSSNCFYKCFLCIWSSGNAVLVGAVSALESLVGKHLLGPQLRLAVRVGPRSLSSSSLRRLYTGEFESYCLRADGQCLDAAPKNQVTGSGGSVFLEEDPMGPC